MDSQLHICDAAVGRDCSERRAGRPVIRPAGRPPGAARFEPPDASG